ncbi:preprotein translocase subunit YajC [Candidatus Babeliales bacterium]|nr:preprotein translocase subunit YajC [Candidatus Babeliales bacterium]
MFTFLFSTLQAQNPLENVKQMGAGSFSFLIQILPLILIGVIFYFFIIRPQNRQRQLLKEMIDNLKIADRVITKGGIIGKISTSLENSFIIELYDGSKIEVLKNAIISTINDVNNSK